MQTISITLTPEKDKQHALIIKYLEERKAMYNCLDGSKTISEGFSLEDVVLEELLMLADCYYNEDAGDE